LPWLVLGGVLLMLLTALGLTTHNRLASTQELMTQQLVQHGSLLLQYLESATRASMRQGVWRTFMLQAFSEELVDQQPVRAMAIMGPHGEVVAAAQVVEGEAQPAQAPGFDPLAGLSESQRQEVAERRPFTGFVGRELVVGKPFEPLRRFMRPGRPLPSWACSVLGEQNNAAEQQRPAEGPDPGLSPEAPAGPPPGARGEAWRGFALRRPGLPPPPGWYTFAPNGKIDPASKPYALVRLSTATLEEARDQDLQQALLLAGVIFLGTGLVSVAVLAAARHRGRELERLRREVAESEHLAAVGRLAGSVAHEVRNPLSALRGLVQFLAKGQAPDSKQAEYASVAVAEVDRLERVVSGLLEYTRPRPPRLFPLDLEESLKGTLDLMKDDPRAQGVDLQLRVEGPLPTVEADPDQLRQLLLNLVVNALEALDGRGSLSVTARSDRDQVVVEVADDGPGLPPEDLAQVFDPFYSTRERGSGLGLAIARRIVQAHGGELKAANRTQGGGGALFTFTLPQRGGKA
jgi:two-component system sensor histidine kinase HydH